MRNITYLFLILFLVTLGVTSMASAAEFKEVPRVRSANDTANGIPSLPYRAVMNQQNTQVYAECMARVSMAVEKEKVLVIPFPKNAQDIQITLPLIKGKSQGEILSWAVEKALPFKPQGSMEQRRSTYESMYDALAGSLAVLKAQEKALVEDMAKKGNMSDPKFTDEVNPNLALIGTRIAAAERELALAKQRVDQLNDALPMSQQLVVRIKSPLGVDDEAFVAYSYTLPNTFWKPTYVINANTKDNTVDVQLLAQIVQNSDLDWFKVQLELTTAQGNERDPAPLYPWIVRKSQGEAMYAKRSMAAPQAMMLDNTVAGASPSFNQESAMARWSIDKFPKLVEGKSTIKLSQEQWKTGLERIARPSTSANKVWLSATHKINSAFYPAGEALFLLDGVATGKALFDPKPGEARIFFGVDPMVTVETKDKTRKSDEKGILDKEQVWTWEWTYNVENKRNIPVTVRIEDPQTQVEDANMSVTYSDSPEPEQGPEKTFVWTIKAPAEGSSSVKRSITVKAPEDMKINLGR